jgi:hypothetical protein
MGALIKMGSDNNNPSEIILSFLFLPAERRYKASM